MKFLLWRNSAPNFQKKEERDAGCAAQHVPLVDIQASPASGTRDFGTDVVECQNYVATIDPDQRV